MKAVAASAFPLQGALDADLEQVVATLHRLYKPLHRQLLTTLPAGSFTEHVYFLLKGNLETVCEWWNNPKAAGYSLYRNHKKHEC